MNFWLFPWFKVRRSLPSMPFASSAQIDWPELMTDSLLGSRKLRLANILANIEHLLHCVSKKVLQGHWSYEVLVQSIYLEAIQGSQTNLYFFDATVTCTQNAFVQI